MSLVVLKFFKDSNSKLFSDLHRNRSEFSIYGDLINERTEIDLELAFGFLKMGVRPIY